MPNTNAIRAGRAFVELFADDSKLVRGLRRAEAKLKAFGNSVRNIGMGMAKLGAAAAAPLIASTKIFTGFDDQMRSVQAVLGATGAQFDLLNEKAKFLGRTTSYTAAQVAGAMLELARAGFNTDEIDKATGDMLALARATGTDLAEATNIAGNTLRSFGLSADEMGRVADVMTATANNSAQTLTDLGEAMKYSAPVADAYGLSIEQTSKALGALANFGIKGSMAGNTMKNIMLQLSNPSIRKKIEALGVTVTDAAGNFRDVGSILTGMGSAIQNMPTPDKLALLNELFGKRAIAGGIKLTAANFEKLNDAIDNANGTAQKTATTMDSDIGGVFRRLWSAVEGVAIAIGDSLAKELSLTGEKITEFATRATDWVKENGALIVSLAKTAAQVIVVGVALAALGKTVAIIGSVVGAIRGMVTAVRVLGKVMVAGGPITYFILAATAVVAFNAAIGEAIRSQYELSDSARQSLAAGDRQRQKTVELSQELESLSKKNRLSSDEMKRATSIIDTLQGQYGDLGLSVDKTSGKILGLAGAQAKLNNRMREAAALEIKAAIAEEESNRDKIQGEKESFWLSRVFSDAEARRQDELNKKQKIHLLRLIALKKRLAEVTSTPSGAAPGSAVTGASPGPAPGMLGMDADADSLKKIQSETDRWQRETHRQKLQAIENEHLREMALMNERYNREIENARKLGSEMETDELVAAINNAKLAERNRLQDEYVRKIREEKAARQEAADKQRTDIDNARRADIEEMTLRSKFKGVELEKKLLKLEEQRAIVAARASGASLLLIMKQFALRRKLLSADTASALQQQVEVRGTFNAAALQGLQSSTTDRIAKATEGTEKNTKDIAKNTKNQTGQTWG
ncbi:MAG: phage tail tape measure protein [Phycisphaerae bacterium]|nr:phage tail tape measure protein [Phycisphaerae bacterium]